MKPHPLAFSTPAQAPAWARWLVYSPAARLAWFALAVYLVREVALGVVALTGFDPEVNDITHIAIGYFATYFVPAVIAYAFLLGVIERRRPAELALRKLLSGLARGMGLGIVLFCAVFGALWLAGSYHLVGTGFPAGWLLMVLMVGPAAGIAEELVFRGALFRIVEEGLGTWAALLVSALAFGALHLGNPNATLWSGIAIAIEAGVLFALVFHVTRSLWVCMGLHAAWNIMEGPVFGAPVSGYPPMGWMHARLEGPEWLSGGAFGPENSLVTIVICTLLAAIFLGVALRRGNLVPPFWRRPAAPADASSP